MIAIAKIGGHQEIIQIGDILEVDKIDAEIGKTVELEVLMTSEEDGSGFNIGTPILENVKAEAKIREHGKGDKIRVFKMKSKKRYRRTRGHRQEFSVIEIVSIGGHSTKTEKPAKKEKKEVSAEEKPKKAPAKKVAKKDENA